MFLLLLLNPVDFSSAHWILSVLQQFGSINFKLVN